ncbi:MAG TPA: ATP-binding cassette domain-containing protein [Lacipirellulaceae bacterium]|jgi:ABC-2 type transport system ATP-binding protein|nr:ATP-binding cassette domain-containing protein [Lacipirellulaceae bacterium]
MSATEMPLVLRASDLSKTFRRETGEFVEALAGISVAVAAGTLTALVGPDGAGKTTLMRLAAGLMTADGGKLTVLGIDAAADPTQIQARIGYMPQRFGLYEDLTVQENLDLYADLHGVAADERRERYPRLMEMTALRPFTDRLAGRLSGGMKQKLGLACTLVRSPELLLLDEPTVGVDPLSRRELWTIILQLVRDQNLTVLVSTSYMDEADRCEHVIVLNQGKVLAEGPPADVTAAAEGRTFLAESPPGEAARDLQARILGAPSIVDAVPEGGNVRFVRAAEASDKNSRNAEDVPEALQGVEVRPVEARFEDGFMVLLRRTSAERVAGTLSFDRPPGGHGDQAVIEVRDLVRMFGSFTAVDHVSFAVRRGEIFGLLGPNGAGKTTTFRMLCGLLPASGGTLRVAGVDVRSARASARQRIGYVAQKYSLYGQLSVRDNLEFFASAYGLRGQRRRERIQWAIEQFELRSFARLASGQLPGGYKQRLAMAAALLHEPEILFLDEPTSGADPLARRDFWRRITSLAAQGVTVIVTTHFMEEAEYCDRVAIMDTGRILAQGSPAEIRSHAKPEPAGEQRSGQPAREPNMEDAFIAIVDESRREEAHGESEAGGAA